MLLRIRALELFQNVILSNFNEYALRGLNQEFLLCYLNQQENNLLERHRFRLPYVVGSTITSFLIVQIDVFFLATLFDNRHFVSINTDGTLQIWDISIYLQFLRSL